MLIVNDLANALWNSFGTIHDKDGLIVTTSQYAQAYANAYIAMIHAGVLQGTFKGTTPQLGQSDAPGTITLDWNIMYNNLISTFNKANLNNIKIENQIVATYLMNNSQILFSIGQVTGLCTATLATPGIFTGKGDGGTVTNLNGNVLGHDVGVALGIPTAPYLSSFYSALVNYTMTNAVCSYIQGNITGPQNSPNGPWTGNGTNGSVS
jgi:hypothetical protein